MYRTDHKSDCPVNYCLEMFGDRWSLLVLRDIVFFGKHTYAEFLDADERIATNVLADRLRRLCQGGILYTTADPNDGRRQMYRLTDAGLGLVPLLLEMMAWGTRQDPHSAGRRHPHLVAAIENQRGDLSRVLTERVASGVGVFDALQDDDLDAIVQEYATDTGDGSRPSRSRA